MPGADRRGFTLLEVLIALLLAALALAALVRAAGDQARALGIQREATLAQWVAANVIAETRLSGTPAPGARRDGEARMGGMRWRWRLEVAATDAPDIRRLDVQVFAADAQTPAASLSGFAGAR